MSVLDTFRRVIPPPSYLRMYGVGVDISNVSLKYIQLHQNQSDTSVLDLQYWGDIEIPDGVVDRGELLAPEKLADILREVRDRTGNDMMYISLPEERAYIFETEIKHGTSAKEVRELLEFRLEENVPLSPRDALFDYELIPNKKSEDMHSVVVNVYARDTITKYYDACRTASVLPLTFEIEAQAMGRAVINKNDHGTHLLVDFGKTRTGIGIIHDGLLMYTSTIDIGGAELSASLRRVLGDLPESELTTLKNTRGLVRAAKASDTYDAMLPTMSAIMDEVRLRIQYWQTRASGDRSRQISSIIFCGGSSNLKGLPEYATEVLGIRSIRGNSWENVCDTSVNPPEIGRRFSYGFSTAVGLALVPFLPHR